MSQYPHAEWVGSAEKLKRERLLLAPAVLVVIVAVVVSSLRPSVDGYVTVAICITFAALIGILKLPEWRILKAVRNEAGPQGMSVKATFWLDGMQLGTNAGYIWIEGRLLKFDGVSTAFSLSNRAGNPRLLSWNGRDTVEINLVDATIRIGFTVNEWFRKDSEPWFAAPLIQQWLQSDGNDSGFRLPPLEPKPEFRWPTERTQRLARWMMPIVLLIQIIVDSFSPHLLVRRYLEPILVCGFLIVLMLLILDKKASAQGS